MDVGFATQDITPAIGMHIPGLFGPRVSTGVLDPLLATVCVIREGDRVVAIVGADAVSLATHTADRIRAAISEATGIPAECTIIAASHTHGGGPTNDVLGSDADGEYLDQLVTLIAGAVVDAHRDLQPADSAQVSAPHEGWTFNRRFSMRDGSEATQPPKAHPDIIAPAGPADPELGVIAFRSVDGVPLGAVGCFACHPTCIFGNEFTGDFPAYWRSSLREALHPDFTLVFLNGACGDINQVDFTSTDSHRGDVAWAREMGCALAARTQELIQSAAYTTDVGLDVASGTTTVPYRHPSAAELDAARRLVASDAPWGREKWVARDRVLLAEELGTEQTVSCQVNAIRIGEALVAAAPWQPFCEFGLTIKSRFPGRPVLLATFANGMIGYVPTPRAFVGGGYEPTLCRGSKLTPDAGEAIVTEHLRVLGELAAD